MRLTADQLTPLGEDGGLIHFIDTVFLLSERPDRVGVAVSGGGDSMALLHLAARWSTLTGVPVEAVTVDHGLRAEAAREAEMVAQTCAKLGVAHTALAWDGPAAQGNLAAAGRDARYHLIASWAQSRRIDGVLLGHTVDDIAETFLMRLARKSGVDGLSVMDRSFERDGMLWGRPLWQQERAELRAYLRRHDVPWVEDPTNVDERYERPKARKVLAALAPLGITAEVLKCAAITQAEARSALEHYTFEEARRAVQLDRGDIVIKRRITPRIPPEIERRLLIAGLRAVGGGAYPPRAQAMLDLKTGLMQRQKHTLAGCVVTQTKQEIRIMREANAVKDITCASDQIWDGRWAIDGPHAPHLRIRTLGESLKNIPDWRETGLPRSSLMASPAVFDGELLIAAPVAGLQNGFDARIVADFASFLLCR